MTAADSVPDDLRAFILRTIDSIAELEALLLLRREPHVWGPKDVAKRLYVSDGAAAQALEHLRTSALVSRDSHGYRYEPATAELAAMVDRLADAFARSLIQVTNIVHEKSRVQQFADAFRFRKEP